VGREGGDSSMSAILSPRCDLKQQEEAEAETRRRWEGWRTGQKLPAKECVLTHHQPHEECAHPSRGPGCFTANPQIASFILRPRKDS
jgi:hypothetical protein